MTLRNLVKELFDELDGGISWILIYKDDKSWFGMSFYSEDIVYDLYDGFILSPYAVMLIDKAYEIDKSAILVNGYYTNIGWSEIERNTIQCFVDGIKHQYELSTYDHQLEYLLLD